ncbi:MAG: OsmC family protein [Pseudomonadota bacterium]
MHIYEAKIRWACEGDFAKGRYSRAHEWAFDGGAVVHGSSSPLTVPLPFSDPTAVDPEEAFVAAISSCHMLWFLDLARRGGWQVARYEDRAKGRMTDDPYPWIDRVDLFPEIDWEGEVPDADTVKALHEEAHARCFIANSVKSDVVVNSQ